MSKVQANRNCSQFLKCTIVSDIFEHLHWSPYWQQLFKALEALEIIPSKCGDPYAFITLLG